MTGSDLLVLVAALLTCCFCSGLEFALVSSNQLSLELPRQQRALWAQLVARLQARAAKENRVDDTNIEVIQYRLDVYEEQTRPVLQRYPLGKVGRVNATQPPEQVTADILRFLEQKGIAVSA